MTWSAPVKARTLAPPSVYVPPTVIRSFDQMLRRPHTVLVKAELLIPGEAPRILPVTAGQVEVDAGATVRRRCSGVHVADPLLVPQSTTSVLQPLQNEIRLYRGLLVNGEPELYPIGTFGITSTGIRDEPGGTTAVVGGMDRSAAVRDNRWTRPFPINPGTDCAEAIRAVLRDRFPAAEFLFPTAVGIPTPGLVFGASSQNDPWKDASEIAKACAHELFVDPMGKFVLRPVQDPDTTAPSWRVYEGEGGNLISVDRQLTRERSYTAVVAEASGTALASPLRSEVSIPSTRPRTYFWKTGAVTTQAQLDAAAQALLLRYSGAYSTVSFSAIPDPRMEVGTVGEITRRSAGVVGRHVLETLSIGLSPTSGPMTGSVRGRNL